MAERTLLRCGGTKVVLMAAVVIVDSLSAQATRRIEPVRIGKK